MAHFSPNQTFISNQVDVIKQDTQIINARLAEQRSSIHGLEMRLIDQNIKQEERFTELESRIAKLEEQINQATLVPQYHNHRVGKGETLWRISMNYYGTGKYVNDLARFNNIANPRLIISGMTIKIPPEATFN